MRPRRPRPPRARARSSLSRRRRGGARGGAVAGQAAAQLLLARAVHPAADDGPVVRGVHAVGRRARLQHGRLALAAADRRGRGPSRSRMPTAPTTISRTSRRTATASSSRRYDGKGFELWRHDLESGAERALTANGGVNLEPRISPDGRQIVFVSTAGTGHFNLKIADLSPAGLANERFLVAPRESSDRPLLLFDARPRRSIRPGRRTASASGSSPMRRSPGARAGSARSPSTGGEARLPRPAPARDVLGRAAGSRAGRQAHPVLELPRRPVAPALAHDDRRRGAAAAHLRRVRPPQRALVAGRQAHRLHQQRGRQHLALGAGGLRRRAHRRSRRRISAASRRPRDRPASSRRTRPASAISARVAVLGSDGRWHAPADAWMHGDELYDRAQFPSEVHYFHCPAKSRCSVELPPGKTTIQVQSGFRRKHVTIEREFPAGETDEAAGPPARTTTCRADFGKFLSADLHVHMNYGGHYRSTPETPARAAGRRGPRRRLQPARQQGRAHPGHRATSSRAATPIRRAASACSSTRRNTTRASGATWAC